MKTFFIKIAAMAMPVLMWMAIVVAVDPYNLFNLCHIIPTHVKLGNAKAINDVLWNTIAEKHSPCDNLLIGDSTTAILPIEEIERISGERYECLTGSALKLNEIVDLFWLANSYRPLRNVYIGINFSMFNLYGYNDRIRVVEKIIRNPLLYIFNRSTAEATYDVLEASVLGSNVISSTPPMTREQFWKYYLDVKADEWYGKYRFPEKQYGEMMKVADYCREKHINLTFIIVPHHVDFQKRVDDYGLAEEKAQFMRSMLCLSARVIDYDYTNEITLSQRNFRDPIHYERNVGVIIAKEVWAGPVRIGRVVTKDYVDCLSKGVIHNPTARAAFRADRNY